jgi:glycosyltransferase involved in cell wall biosynthesis
VLETLMKLIVQIPCFNEEATLPQTIGDIPRAIPGIDVVEVLIVDDGSTDRTVEVALRAGADHIVRHKTNRGLAEAFRTGIDACLIRGADIIVNTDGDNQYAGASIPALIRPIQTGQADIVIGDRQVAENPHFAWTKKRLQALGSFVVRRLSGVAVTDAVSGFRAVSHEAAMRLNIVSPFSYTIEMLIQAGRQRMAVVSVPVTTNLVRRHSRLFSSVPQFMLHSLATMLRIYTMYYPLRMFAYFGATLTLLGLAPIARFLYFYVTEGGVGHIQSLVLGGVFLMMGFVAVLVGVVADLINFNRRLAELTLQKIRGLEVEAERGRSLETAAAAPLQPPLGTPADERGQDAQARRSRGR